jgi:hypothetical protein
MGGEPEWEQLMTSAGWSFVEVAAYLLEREEREVVLGDLIEAGESAWLGLWDVLGLVARRQLVPLKSWRLWLASFGLALPGSLLLMGFSVSISQTYQRLIHPAVFKATGLTIGPGFTLLLCNVLLLIGWSWTGGFVMGSVSRRTVRVSAVLSFLPCVFCLAKFRVESLSRFCLLLFMFPAVWGVRRGLQISQIRLRTALILAVAITLLTSPTWSSSGSWIPNWALSWPAWYLVATAWGGPTDAKLDRSCTTT